jgi:hypothetical protein
MKTVTGLWAGVGVFVTAYLGLNLLAPDAIRRWGLDSDSVLESIRDH